MLTLYIILGVIVVYIIYKYNSLLAMRNRIKEAFGAIEVYLQNRYDALLKVAEVVVNYAKYEEKVLTDITRIREGLTERTPDEKLKLYENLNNQLSAIQLKAEEYPELKANENFLHLQHTANDLEEKLSASRRTYNANVVAFNTAIASFPANLISGLLGFREQAMYEVPETKKEDVSMKQLLNS